MKTAAAPTRIQAQRRPASRTCDGSTTAPTGARVTRRRRRFSTRGARVGSEDGGQRASQATGTVLDLSDDFALLAREIGREARDRDGRGHHHVGQRHVAERAIRRSLEDLLSSVPADERIRRRGAAAAPAAIEASVHLDGSLDAFEVRLHVAVAQPRLFGHTANTQRARVDQDGDQRTPRGGRFCRGNSLPSCLRRGPSTHSRCIAVRPRRIRASPLPNLLLQTAHRGDAFDRSPPAVAMNEGRAGASRDAIGRSLTSDSGNA